MADKGGKAKAKKEPKPAPTTDIYYPFKNDLFRKKSQYKTLKFKNKGIARGLKWRRGFPTTKIGKFAGTFRASGHKNPALMNRAMKAMKMKTHEKRQNRFHRPGRKFVVSVIRETVGWAPYEKRAMELIRAGNPKKAKKFLNKRLGNHKRAKRKRSKLEKVIASEAKLAQQRAQAAKKLAEEQAAAAKAAAKPPPKSPAKKPADSGK
eukprot:CAMPEP_0197022060 /NCGR_PEP_ID=MMETSP1384-20130603/2965_1 /TAXON_ID=29189 /ORGANISM="Ammonia sp." /LENGTH=206 /DNA_ID=CAMNT_0042450025 /DNA_START=91 /DNA_END=711 /DNA_ORIENTATION=+